MMQWVKDEMEGLELRDARINRRAVKVLDALAHAGESTPDSFRTKAALDGTYRFMSNEKVSPESLLAPHNRQSIARTSRYERVLLVQDTTEVDLTKPNRQVKDAGPLGCNSRRGFFLHPLLAYTPNGMPLGIVSSIQWTRSVMEKKSTPEEKKKQRNNTPIEEKESYRWIEMTREGKQIAANNPQTEYIGISDSESDIYELFAEIECRPRNYHLLVRGCQDRAIADYKTLQGSDETSSAAKTIGDALNESPLCYKMDVNVRGRKSKIQSETRQRRQSRADRVAAVEVRAAQVTIRPPYRPDRRLPAMTVNVVEVRETDAPIDEPPVHWMLITTLPIKEEEQVREVVATYKMRWNIEVYFRTLKSGMGLEKLRYQTLGRYMNATMLLMIVAWRVQMLTHAAREESDAPCSAFVDDTQWKPLYLVTHPADSLPDVPPTIGEFLVMLAKQGGYIKRKGQGPPGTITVWRGIRRLETLSLAWTTFGQRSKLKM